DPPDERGLGPPHEPEPAQVGERQVGGARGVDAALAALVGRLVRLDPQQAGEQPGAGLGAADGHEPPFRGPPAVEGDPAQPEAALVLEGGPGPPADEGRGVVRRDAHGVGATGGAGAAGAGSGVGSCGATAGTGSSSGSTMWVLTGRPISIAR